ncbi:MAG: HEAT repeat domain-containing protein [Planctomycetota bacterium]
MSREPIFCWILILFSVLQVGCSEGLFWKTGKYVPWAQKKWAEEEKIADTLFARKRMMSEAAASVAGAPVETQQQVARKLATVLSEDSVLLLRLHAINLLGQLDCPAANTALANSIIDSNSDIRVASVKAFENMPPNVAVPQLAKVADSDRNIDVRLAATRALGNFTGRQTVTALAVPLNDSDPALQLRAVESLQKVTGENIGKDVGLWQQYVANFTPSNRSETRTAGSPNADSFR